MKNTTFDLESGILDWLRGLRESGNLDRDDEEELDGHLRDQIDELSKSGLSDSEAFMIAVRRLGSTHAIAREYYKVNGRKLWKHLDPAGDSLELSDIDRKKASNELLIVVALTLGSAIIAQIPYLFGLSYVGDNSFAAMRQSLFLFFPGLVLYIAWKRRLSVVFYAISAAIIVAGALTINIYPYKTDGDTLYLSLVHLALLYWTLFGLLYTSYRTATTRSYVDFLRFTGELFIYTVLVTLGGGVLIAVGNAIFGFIGIDISALTQRHFIIAGAFGAPVLSTYLVEAKRNVIENIAPVLAKIFIPLFLVVMLAFLIALLITGSSPFADREPLIILDILLFLILAMVFYSISSRDHVATKSIADYANFGLLAVAAVVDTIALSAIIYRLSSFGFSPNKFAALGENVLLLIHLLILLVVYGKYLFQDAEFGNVERWTAKFIPVYAAWFLFVAVIMPPIFRFA